MILRTPIDEPDRSLHVMDDREPNHYWTEFNRDTAHPLARGVPYVEDESHRHVFDALVVFGKETEQPDNPALSEHDNWMHPPANHREFRMNLTCVQCGQIVGLEGILTANETYKRVDPVPLRAKHLDAQHTSSWGSYRAMMAWAVYAGEDQVGVMSSGLTPRGREYVEGFVVDADGTKHKAEAPTAIGLLRKLASAHAQRPAA